jgi:hypothetical protein
MVIAELLHWPTTRTQTARGRGGREPESTFSMSNNKLFNHIMEHLVSALDRLDNEQKVPLDIRKARH